MKYEIRIISEEDTIKSKPYEDLDKAIEIADSIYQNFVNSDFGDEIVVVKENSKDKKYYWANGKTLIEELKVGDIVKIINNGDSYTTYTEFMTQYATPTQCCLWDYNSVPKEDETQYIIRGITHHPRGDRKLAIIQNYYRGEFGKIYLMGVEGLQKI